MVLTNFFHIPALKPPASMDGIIHFLFQENLPMNRPQTKAIFFAFLAAALYAVNSPLSKLLLSYIPPTLMASYLYLGAGIGLLVVSVIQKKSKKETEELPLTSK